MDRCLFRVCLLLFAQTAFCLGICAPLEAALGPDSPEVKAAVAKAIKYLETVSDPRMGAKALRATVLLKNGADPGHPVVQRTVYELRAQLASLDKIGNEHVIYSTSVALIFFCSFEDTSPYQREIEQLIRFLLSEQKPHGGWGYPDKPTGDTSMTQHVVLAFWEALEKGYKIPQESLERVADWLLRVQDPSGGFGYQGIVSSGGQLVPQAGVAHSLTGAAMGSVYICADVLGITEKKGEADKTPGLTKVGDQQSVRFRSRMAPDRFKAVMSRGDAWLKKNHKVNPGKWAYYYLYSSERYWTFKEALEGPKGATQWYEEAARWVLSQQKEDGSWTENASFGASVNAGNHTAFAALFLLRSTWQVVSKARNFGPGVLIGGKGLPKDSDMVTMRDGRVVSAKEPTDLEKLLSQVGDVKEGETVPTLPDLPPSEVKALVSKQAGRLRALAGGTSADQRLAAVDALARGGGLDDVPILIYALSDPEADIVLAARSGLRRISRKIHGFDLPDDFDEADRRTAVQRWRQWYLAIRPDAEFEG